jgi:HTH-type transcriptional regulator, transcriptional repressor of NAD biosynthesis genes
LSVVRRGLVLGKFLPYHAGHAHLIRTARAQVDDLTVLVCSIAQEPIPGETRFAWVTESHPDCRVIHVSEEVPQSPEDHPDFWTIWTDLIRRYVGSVEAVFTSEAYGDPLAQHLSARHVCVDPQRSRVPVSGTAIRRDPLAHWEFIPAVVRPAYAHRVTILGAESTGKTTLAEALAKMFDTTWVPEYGRAYCEERDPRQLSLDDFDAIARGQIDMEDRAARLANRVLICDTDVRTTATWSELIRGGQSEWLATMAAMREYSHALLLGDDVPWINDGTRVLQHERRAHTVLLEDQLRLTKQPYTRIDGPFDERLERAAAVVRRVLQSSPKPRVDPPTSGRFNEGESWPSGR